MWSRERAKMPRLGEQARPHTCMRKKQTSLLLLTFKKSNDRGHQKYYERLFIPYSPAEITTVTLRETPSRRHRDRAEPASCEETLHQCNAHGTDNNDKINIIIR